MDRWPSSQIRRWRKLVGPLLGIVGGLGLIVAGRFTVVGIVVTGIGLLLLAAVLKGRPVDESIQEFIAQRTDSTDGLKQIALIYGGAGFLFAVVTAVVGTALMLSETASDEQNNVIVLCFMASAYGLMIALIFLFGYRRRRHEMDGEAARFRRSDDDPENE